MGTRKFLVIKRLEWYLILIMGIGGQARPKWFNKRGPIGEVVQNRPRGMRNKSCLLWEAVIFDRAGTVDNYCKFHHHYSLTRTLKTWFDLNDSLRFKYCSCLRWVKTNFNHKLFFKATLLSFERLDKTKQWYNYRCLR